MQSQIARRRTVAALLALAAAVGYALLWVGYRQGWGWLAAADSSTLRAGYAVGVEHPAWVRFWDVVSTVFAPAAFRLLGMAAAVAAVVRRRLRSALFVLVCVEPSGLIIALAKGLADRPRPVTALVASGSSSFPSGHALGVMVGVAALLAVARPVLNRRTWLAAVAVGALVVVAVGVARVALNMHHPSDVLAGWALGYLYFAVCVRLLKPEAGGG